VQHIATYSVSTEEWRKITEWLKRHDWIYLHLRRFVSQYLR
jgi:hypothetical protein